MKHNIIIFIILIISVLVFGLFANSIIQQIQTAKKEKQDGAIAQKEEEMHYNSGDIVAYITPSVQADNVSFIFTVKNETTATQEVIFTSSEKFQYIVTNEQGEVVFDSSKDKLFSSVMKETTIKPSGEFTYNGKVRNLDKGSYSVQFIWRATQYDVTANEKFSIHH